MKNPPTLMETLNELNAISAAAHRGTVVSSAPAKRPPLPPRPTLKPQTEKPSRLPPLPPKRAMIDQSSSIGDFDDDFVEALPFLEGEGLLLNHEGLILLIISMFGRITLDQLTVAVAFIKKEGPYKTTGKAVTMEAYRDNSVRRRVAKMVRIGYLHRLPPTSRNVVFYVSTALGQQVSTVKGHLQRDLLNPAFDIHQLDIVRHNAMLSSATAAIRTLTGQITIEMYDRSQHRFRSLTQKGGLNVVSGPSIYDAAKAMKTDDPAGFQRATLEAFIMSTYAGHNRSRFEPYPHVRSMPPLTGSHSATDKGIIDNHIRAGVPVEINGTEHIVPAAYLFAPLCYTPRGVELVNVVNFAVALPNVVVGNSISSGSLIAHVDSTGTDSEEELLSIVFHLNNMVNAHAYIGIFSDSSLYEGVKQRYSNALRILIERGDLPEGARDRMVFVSYELINSKGTVSFYKQTNARYAVTPSMG